MSEGVMNKSKAIQVYLKYNTKALEVIRRISLYDPKKSLAENANKIGIDPPLVYLTKINYYLGGRSSRVETKNKEIYKKIKNSWNPSLNISGNAKALGVSIYFARC